MINDIREYYCNLTKLQRKKFEVLFEELYYESVESKIRIDIYKVMQYLRISYKIFKGKKFDVEKYNQLTDILIIEIEEATKFLSKRKNQFDKIFSPDYSIDNSGTLNLVLDLFQRVLK